MVWVLLHGQLVSERERFNAGNAKNMDSIISGDHGFPHMNPTIYDNLVIYSSISKK